MIPNLNPVEHSWKEQFLLESRSEHLLADAEVSWRAGGISCLQWLPVWTTKYQVGELLFYFLKKYEV